MKNAFTSSLVYIIFLSLFIIADFISITTYLLALPLFGLTFILEPFYQDNQKSFEIKDMVFGLLFTFIAYLLYTYFNEPFNFDTFSTLTLIHTIVFVNIGCIYRYRILI